MIVCLCAGVNERTIEGLVAEGVVGADALGQACDAGRHCGSCRADLERLSHAGPETATPSAESGRSLTSRCAA